MNEIKHTDILIVGGGSAGVAAAVAASSRGQHVTLLERNSFLGGKATAAEVGTICGLYEYSRNPASTYIVKGFAREFAERLKERSGSCPLNNNEGLHYLPYQVEAFGEICNEYLAQKGVTVLLNATVENITIRSGIIETVSVAYDNSNIIFQVKAVVDCSGDSVISKAANMSVIKDTQYQAAAQVFSMQGVTEENEARLGMIMMKALRAGIEANEIPAYYDRVYIVQGSLKNGHVNLKLGIPVPVTYEKGNVEEIQRMASEFVQGVSDYLIQHVAAYKNAVISHIAPEAGIRIGERTMGTYLLTEDDVLNCRKFPDAIANGSWPVEIWEQDRRVKMHYFALDNCYQVPAGCLQAAAISNLYMAGRNISATRMAIASARVMGICLQTGFAAGCMAFAKAAGVPREDILEYLQNLQL
ncbi:MAG: FAD-dependent oxidoreductase [Bacteroidetes bacterium]|nr:FAD-dependent oxidoreductase [Bacteroidota bacterium]